MPHDLQYDVFLSHNPQDRPRVRRLAERLRDAGLRVWFDEWAVEPGDDVTQAAERGIEASRVQVLCLSPAALGADWVTLERSMVPFRDPAKAERSFIPLLLADCDLPDTLRRYRTIDYREETGEATIRWMNVSAYLRRREDKTSRQIIFDGEELTMEAVWRVRDGFF